VPSSERDITFQKRLSDNSFENVLVTSVTQVLCSDPATACKRPDQEHGGGKDRFALQNSVALLSVLTVLSGSFICPNAPGGLCGAA
jgi:hypothetical protein